MKKHIPNIVTLGNLMSGIIAVMYALEGNAMLAMLFVVTGSLFDFADGATARALKVSSPIGRELDSLADMVTFGFTPGATAFVLLHPLARFSAALPYLGFLITLFSALRLAKFNIDTRQTTSFIGLPTPANALFWLGLAIVAPAYAYDWSMWLLLCMVGLSCWLLVAEVPMFSLKFHNFRFRDNWVRYLFLLISLAAVIVLREKSLVFIIAIYIILSLLLRRHFAQ